MLLSVFCGAGGLDLGFEQSGYDIGLALDKRKDSIESYRRNRNSGANAEVADIREMTLERLDQMWGGTCAPSGVIGGPPCQSFSQANQSRSDEDPRHSLPLVYADLLLDLNSRYPVPFFVMENVPGLVQSRHAQRLAAMVERFEGAGFVVAMAVLDSSDYNTPQRRRRLFIVGLNKVTFDGRFWIPPEPPALESALTVRSAIGHLSEPAYWSAGLTPDAIPVHPNHWTTMPKSHRFKTAQGLFPGNGRYRSFKTLDWEQPSFTVAYGHREMHVHPNLHRRVSIHEALLLQGFPPEYVLLGSLSSQVLQVSEAVPPTLAKAVADTLPLGERKVSFGCGAHVPHSVQVGIAEQLNMFPAKLERSPEPVLFSSVSIA